jgi:DNA segregation ATPase FtsK/SpoIIIE, S-DNA-T family
VCAIAVSFAQTTSAASGAVLGESIRDFPDADPMTLQGREYVWRVHHAR